MRQRVITFLKFHPRIINIFWKCARFVFQVWGIFVPVRNTMLFASFGGRKYDDSPKAIYDEVCKRAEFDDWELIWVFVNPDDIDISRGKKIKVDTFEFFYALLYSKVWVSNSGMDRGIGLQRKKTIKVETWHGAPLKKIGEDQNQNVLGGKKNKKVSVDTTTIRCAQSEFDRDIFARVFHASKECFLLSDLPRNDALFKYDDNQLLEIRKQLGIAKDKKVILYTPTYREYLVNEDKNTYLLLPMNFDKWRQKLGDKYVLLIRAHYAVSTALNLKNDDFVKDVSAYPTLNDLYVVADMMISDYSSTFFDYSILCRPIFCYAYDLEEYKEKRGLYSDLKEILHCTIDVTEDELIEHILNLDDKKAILETEKFHKKYTPNAGYASEMVVNEIVRKLL